MAAAGSADEPAPDHAARQASAAMSCRQPASSAGRGLRSPGSRVWTSTETSPSLVSTDNRSVAQQRALGTLSARNRARGLTHRPDIGSGSQPMA